MSKKSIVGIAKSTSQVEDTLNDLQSNGLGFRQRHLGFNAEFRRHTRARRGQSNQSSRGGNNGSGNRWRGRWHVGLLAGIGALAIPGLGPFIAAGPIMAALSGAAAGATAGGVVGALVGLGIPEYEAKAYEERIKKGGYLVAVHIDNGKTGDDVRDIMKQNGLEDISSVSEK